MQVYKSVLFSFFLFIIAVNAKAQVNIVRPTPKELVNAEYPYNKTIAHKAISNYGNIVAAGYTDGSIDLWKADGNYLLTIPHCFPENDFYNDRAIYINEEEQLIAWGQQVSKGWNDESPEHLFCWKKFSGTDTTTHQLSLPDDPYSIDYDAPSKKWLVGTGSLSFTSKFVNPGIYWIDAVQAKLIKEWHVTNRYSMQVKFAPGASWFMAMGYEYYSKDTIQTIYTFSGRNYEVIGRNNTLKGSTPGFCPLPDGSYVVSFNFSPVMWVVKPGGERKMIKADEYDFIEQIFYDAERKACTVLFRKSDNNEYEWVQYDEDWQALDKKMFRTDARIAQANYHNHRALSIATADSVLGVNAFTLPVPQPKLYLQLQTGHSQTVDEVVMHPSLPLAASNSRGEGKIKIWDLQTGFQICDIKTGYAEDVKFVPGKTEIVWKENGKIFFYDYKIRSVTKEFVSEFMDNFPFTFDLYPDSKTLEIAVLPKFSLRYNLENDSLLTMQKIGMHINSFRILDNGGSKIYYSYRTSGDSIGYINANGKVTASRYFREVNRWWLNKDKTEVAVLLSKNGRLHNTELQILELPSLKTKKTIPLNISETAAPDPSFTKLVTANADTMFIRNINDNSNEQVYFLKDEYFSSLDPLDWDITGQYVVRTDITNNGIRLFRSYWRKLGENILIPVLLQADPRNKQLIAGTDNGLWSMPLNYLKKATLLDTQARYIGGDKYFIQAIDKNILYSASFFGNDYGKTMAASSLAGKTGAVSSTVLDNQVYHKTLNWVAGTTRNGYIHLVKLDTKFNIVQHDSLPGARPMFAEKKPYLAYLGSDGKTLSVYNFEHKQLVDTFALPLKEEYPNLGAGFSFICADEKLIWSRYSGGTIYSLTNHPLQRKFYTTHDITVLLPAADTTGFYAGDNVGNIFYINASDGKTIKTFFGHTEDISSLTIFENNLYSASKDGTIKIWNTDSAILKLTMVLDIDGQVLIIDNETNNYASSRRDPKTMAFVYKSKVLPFEQFDLFANRPDEVLTKTGMADKQYISSVKEAVDKRIRRSGKSTNLFQTSLPAVTINGLNELPLIVKQRMLSLPVTAADSAARITALHVLINGVPLYGTKGLTITSPAKKYATALSLPLSTGKNRIEIIAENEKLVQSAKEVLQIEYEPAEAATPKFYYIGVGVSQYADSARNLVYAAKDIMDMAAAFREKYPDAVIHTLTDANATRENLLQLKQWLQQTSVDDNVVISFSGHGLLDKQKDFYFATHKINFKEPQKEGWSFADMQWLLDSIPARNKLLLVDACHSGEVDKDEVNTSVKKDSVVSKGARSSITGDEPVVGLQNSFALMQELFSDLGNSNGTVMITAAGGRQYALEGVQWNNGVFTYALLRGLKEMKADANNDGAVSISELRNYLFNEVQRLTDGRQQPTTRTENLVNDWSIW